MKSYEYFSAKELACQCGECDGGQMDDLFMSRIVKIRKLYGRPMRVSSAFRCPAHNKKVSTTGEDGPHTTGHAIDILVSHRDAIDILRLAMFTEITGFGVHQKGDARFLHLDDLRAPEYPRPNIWSY